MNAKRDSKAQEIEGRKFYIRTNTGSCQEKGVAKAKKEKTLGKDLTKNFRDS